MAYVVMTSSIATGRRYPDSGLGDFVQSLRANSAVNYKLCQDRFLLYPFQLSIHQLSYIRRYCESDVVK
jgi:hypothetical protein